MDCDAPYDFAAALALLQRLRPALAEEHPRRALLLHTTMGIDLATLGDRVVCAVLEARGVR